MFRAISRSLLLLTLATAPIRAELILNSSQPITERVTVQVITAAASNGSNPAPGFGDAVQQSEIFGSIDAIWAQAGIDVEFKFRLASWNDDFTLLGTPGNNDPRSTDDLSTIFDNPALAGLLDPDPLVLNLMLVQIVPGFSQTGEYTSNGLAFLDGNGIAFWAGPGLLTFTEGLETIAAVLAHEIGHNLGLDHLETAQNLMQSGLDPSYSDGQRLDATQIAIALASPYSVPIPEPGAFVLLLCGATALATRKRPAMAA